MARARLLKPGFFKNEDLWELSPWARLLFAGLWTLADKAGRLEDRPKRIKAELFPCDDVDVDTELDALAKAGFIARYMADDMRLVQVLNFEKHQHTHVREPESVLPAPACMSHEHRTSTGLAPDEHQTDPSEAEAEAEAVTEAKAEAEAAPPYPPRGAAGAAGPFSAEEMEAWKASKTTALRCYEDLFGLGRVNKFIADELVEIDDGWEDECIEHCFREAAQSNARNFKLVRTILDRHKAEGCYAGRPEEQRYARAKQPVTSGGYLDAADRFEQRLNAR